MRKKYTYLKELHEFRRKEFSARTFGPIRNFFDGKIESPAPSYSFRIGPEIRAENSWGRNSDLPS